MVGNWKGIIKPYTPHSKNLEYKSELIQSITRYPGVQTVEGSYMKLVTERRL